MRVRGSTDRGAASRGTTPFSYAVWVAGFVLIGLLVDVTPVGRRATSHSTRAAFTIRSHASRIRAFGLDTRPVAGAGCDRRHERPARAARSRPSRPAAVHGFASGRWRRRDAVPLSALWAFHGFRRLQDLARPARRLDRPALLCRGRRGDRHAGGHGELHADGPRARRHRNRPHLVFAVAPAHTKGDRGYLPDGATRLRRARLPPAGVENRRPERCVPSGGGAVRFHLRGGLQAAPGREGPQPRHRLVLDPRWRVADRSRRVRGLAGAGELRVWRGTAPLPGGGAGSDPGGGRR